MQLDISFNLGLITKKKWLKSKITISCENKMNKQYELDIIVLGKKLNAKLLKLIGIYILCI